MSAILTTVKFLNTIILNVSYILFISICFFVPLGHLNRFEVITPGDSIFEIEPKIKDTTPFESFPVRILIKSIQVDASIQAVGTLDGVMAVPNSKEYVGWYKFGTHPGEIGSAVLAGHVNWKNDEDAVFSNLKNITIGDSIIIFDNFGKETIFIVEKIENYPVETDTTEIFISNDNVSKLNLITCYGEWNPEKNTHDLRLVVFAHKL